MRKAFTCSLCRDGILGGGLYLDDRSVIYRTEKLSANEEYRNLILPLNEIRKITWKWIVFPVATFHMENGEEYKIIIFNKWRFRKCYQKHSGNDTKH